MENKIKWVFSASSVLKEKGVWLGVSLVKQYLFSPVRLGLSHCSVLKKQASFFFNDHVSVDLGPQRGCHRDYLSTSHAWCLCIRFPLEAVVRVRAILYSPNYLRNHFKIQQYSQKNSQETALQAE